jgi:hypothetical protein
MDDGDKDQTYEWLKKRCETALRFKREDSNQDGNRKANREGQAYPDQHAAPAEGQERGKKKGKGKGGGSHGGTPTASGRLPLEAIPCKFIYKFQSCTKGDECPYAHREPTAAEILKFGFEKPATIHGSGKGRSKGDKAKLPCWAYAFGTCKYGDDCKFLHAKAKNKASASR